MRLTLRTLLAYMDGVLDSEDAEEIARKVEESEYATEIVHRTRDVVRRLRLGAPPIDPRGKGLDANSVAEYLDNTLTAERVADFEALCLDTDIHLAEVAGCHQILTYVLGAPADVDPDTRKRIYGLISGDAEQDVAKEDTVKESPKTKRSSAAEKATGASASNGEAERDAERDADDRPSPEKRPLEVPDYLRDQPPAPKTGRFIAIALLLLVGAVIVVGMQPDWLPGFLKFGQDTVAQNDGANDTNAANENSQQGNQAANANGNAENAQDAGDLKQPDDANQLGNQAAPDGGNAAPPNDANAAMPPLPEQANPPGNADAGNADAAAGDGTDEGSADGSGDANNAANANAGDNNAGEANLPANAVEDSPPLPQVVGQLTSTEAVLLRFGGTPPSLSRSPPRGDISTREALISLPDFRNVITLGADGVAVQAVGETHFEFETTRPAETLPRIHLKQGRLLFNAAGGAGTRMRLRTGDLEYALTFQQPGTTLAIEARRVRVDGALPHETNCPTELIVDCVAGKAVWESFARGGRHELDAGMRWALSATSADPLVASVAAPEWATTMNLAPLAARGAEQIEQYLRGELAVRVRQAFLEQTASNRVEVASLAMRCLAAADDFDAVISTLDDTDYRAFWDQQMESLHKAVVRSPESAALVKIALESQRGDDAPELYRMLWGYTAGELLEQGHAAKLVEYLSHEDLDFRVLASWNLREITGIEDIPYRPDSNERSRIRAVNQWQNRLNKGEVVPKPNN